MKVEPPSPPGGDKSGSKRTWTGLGFGAAILRSLLASFSLSVFQYLVIPFFGVRPAWSELFIFYLGITLVSAVFVGLLLRNLPAVVVGKMVVFSLVASLFVVYADHVSGSSITSDLFFPATPSFASVGQAFMIFTFLGILSTVLVRLLFKKWKW